MKKLYTLSLSLALVISASAQTYFTDDFEGGSLTGNNAWIVYDVAPSTSGLTWVYDNFSGNNYAEMTNWNGTANEAVETWLITPAIDMATATQPMLVFDNMKRYGGDDIQVMISTDYDGSSDPSIQGTWADITSSATLDANTGSWNFVSSGNVDISSYISATTYIGFKYIGGTTDGSTWEIDNVSITEGGIQATSVTISQIQTSAGASNYEDSLVATGGIVTAVNANGYNIQAGTGAFSGLWIQDATGAGMVARGDSVLVTGTIEEFFSFTRMNSVTSMSVEAAGLNEPAATVVTTQGANDEMWEGVKIQVENSTCLLDNDGFGQWLLNDGSDTILIDNEFYQYPTPVIGNVYTVTGIGWYSFSEFKMEPRDINDIQNTTGIEAASLEMEVYPNPMSDVITIRTNAKVERILIMDLSGRVVMQSGLAQTTLNVKHLASGQYIVQVVTSQGTIIAKMIK